MRIHAVLLTAVTTLALSAPPTPAAEDFTVGDFLVTLSRAEGLDAGSGQQARTALADRGVTLPADLALGSPLTERHVVAIARGMGLRVATTRPDAIWDADQGTRFVEVFGGEWSAGNTSHSEGDEGEEDGEDDGDGPAFDPFTKGKGSAKGKGKGPPFSPIE